MLKKKIPAALLAIVLLVSLVAFGATTAYAVDDDNDNDNQPTTPTFTDVPGTHPQKTEIEYCATNRFVLGYGDGTFRPDGEITREQFVTVWARTFHARRHDFNDATKIPDEMDNAIVLMYGLGYINGVSTTRFSRTDKITREQVAQIVKNTYLQGVNGHDAYEAYSDAASIADWAQDAVSVVRDKGIFAGVTTDNKFEPTKPITRAETCVIIYNLMQVAKVHYTITVDVTGDGTVVPNKITAAAGEIVRFTVTPGEGMRLKANTLMLDDAPLSGTSFIMPAKNVVITAEFEEIPILNGIAVKTEPDTTTYTAGETLDLTGLEITVNYTNYPSKDITTGFTTVPANGATLDTTDDKVTVSYSEEGETKTADFNITVNPAS